MPNPFNPGFGKLPEIYLDRGTDVSQVISGLAGENHAYQTTLVYGMRGTGKTAFLTDVATEAEKKGWITADLAMGTPMVQILTDTICSKAQGELKTFLNSLTGISVSAFGLSFSAERKPAPHQYQTLLMQILLELKKKGLKVLVTIDEVKDDSDIRELAAIYQLCLRKDYDISLIMAGLPENVSALQNDDVLTFLLRAARVTLKPIDLFLITDSYRSAFHGHREISPELLTKIARLTCGYAYAFQLLGYYLWETSASTGVISGDTVNAAMEPYKRDLYRNSYLKIFHGLSDVEQQFITAMAEYDGPAVPVSSIRDKLQKSTNYISTYRLRLLDTQVISAPKRGYLQFTLPFFRDFVLTYRELY